MTARAEALALPLQILRLALLCVGAAFSLTALATPALALAAGIVIALVVGNPWSHVTGSASSGLLKVAIVALDSGSRWIGSSAPVPLALGLGRRMQIERRLTILITAGTSICGGSAIAAVGPAIGATREAMSVSLATVFMLPARRIGST